ncbi:MAG: hypothetical protein ACK5JH_02340 [Anaerocolumna sp.]
MNGTIITLIEKLLDYHMYLEGFYDTLLKSNHIVEDYALKNTALVLKSLENKHCVFYKETLASYSNRDASVSDKILSEVDFNLINLKQSLNSYGIVNAKQMIANAIDCENKQIFLLSKITDMLEIEGQDEGVVIIMRLLKKEEENNLELLQPFI